jgi:hypothetical protein
LICGKKRMEEANGLQGPFTAGQGGHDVLPPLYPHDP